MRANGRLKSFHPRICRKQDYFFGLMIKNQTTKKNCVIKKLKFENYNNCLETTQLDNKTKCL